MSNKAKGERCAIAGCKGWAMHDGSGLCFSHNPAKEEVRLQHLLKLANNRRNKGMLEGSCAFEGCRGWAMHDGSGFCRIHNPNYLEKSIEVGWKISKTKRTN